MRPYRKAAVVVGRDRTRRRHRGMREHRFRVRRGQPPDIRRSWRGRSRRARADFGFAIDCAQRWETLGPTIWDGKHLVLNPLRTRAQRLEGLDRLILALTTDTGEIAIAPELHESRQTFHRRRVERRKPRAVRRWPQHAPVQHPGQFEVVDECAANNFPGKVVGGTFIHDFELPGMLHGRVLRPPSYGARLASLDTSAVERLPGFVKLWRSGDFVGVCCEREYQAVKALEALRTGAQWIENEVFPVPNSWAECLPTLRTIDAETEIGSRPPPSPNVRRVSATYSKPMLAHASMAPSCAVAFCDDGRLTLWTHSQGVFPLRGSLAATLGIDEQAISVIHVQGAGVYGHNGADDVALDAALLARQVPSR